MTIGYKSLAHQGWSLARAPGAFTNPYPAGSSAHAEFTLGATYASRGLTHEGEATGSRGQDEASHRARQARREA